MTSDMLLQVVADTCREVIRDAVSGLSVCRNYEDATLILWMQTHQLLGLRRLMLPLATRCDSVVLAESVFDRYLSQLEDIKSGSRSLMGVNNDIRETVGASSPASL